MCLGNKVRATEIVLATIIQNVILQFAIVLLGSEAILFERLLEKLWLMGSGVYRVVQ